MSGPAPREYSKAETADFLQKVRQEMEAKSDPLRSAIMSALFESKDPRVAAVRRKSSIDQLRAVVECAARAYQQTKGEG